MIHFAMTSPDKFKFTYNQASKIPDQERQAFEYLCEWIVLYTGLHFPHSKHLNLYHRLNNLCFRLGLQDLNEMAQHLKLQDIPELPAELAHVTSTNHSFFFREPEVLDFFTNRIIPNLPFGNSWRIWSAAAASGEEAFTLAIILSETLGIHQALSQVAILGTDISYPMISDAEKGIYHKQKLELVNEVFLKRYFQQVDPEHWVINPMLRPLCTFRRMNLNSMPWPFSNQFHVVFLRNILYYFNRECQQDLVERVYDITLPGGWLITSVTETLYWAKTRWHPVTTGVYQKI